MAHLHDRVDDGQKVGAEGGEVGSTSRWTTPFSSRILRRAASTFAEIRGMSRRSSPKRRGPPLRYQITFGVQAPPRSVMQAVSGHSGAGWATLLLRSFRPMGGYLVDS